ncbi:glycerate kinase type-2 family protein [Thalassospira alkalitolerans]|uniref:glycerate kinase type-2 family protein n=1 Tax=Thalassospira alkalitolerans TaxID=1293890 RepID=UPI003AA7DF49
MSDIVTDAEARSFLREMFDAAILAADPDHCVPRFLPAPPQDGRTVVIGAGKAAAKMASAVETHWNGPLEGIVVTRYGHSVPTKKITVIEAAHPVPDAAGVESSRRIRELVSRVGKNDLVICLISGGGSALLVDPLSSVTLEEKQAISRSLLKSGANIGEMNCVRRHLSAVKGGRLAVDCYPARVVTLAISDVPGDDPLDIASGPTVADPTSSADALAILDRYDIEIPDHIRILLTSDQSESVKPGDHRLARAETVLIATPQMALEAAAEIAKRRNIKAHILGDAIEGEARDVGRVIGGIARHTARHGQPFAVPCVLLSGGETTVTVRGNGRGGRNVEFLLSLASTLDGEVGIHAVAGDTDGIDGIDEIAGACITPDTLARARAFGLNVFSYLARNDGHSFFERLGDSIVTGPTLTNVNDFRAVFVTGTTDPTSEK